MLGRDKTRVVLVVEKRQSQLLDAWAQEFEWSKSKTGAMAMRIGMVQLGWAYEILHKRWDHATTREKSEAIHWLEVAGLIPYDLYEKLDDEISLDDKRKEWNEALKRQRELVSELPKKSRKSHG